MLGIAAPQLRPHRRVTAGPEAREVFRHLNGAMVRGEDFDDDLEVRRKVIRAVRAYIGPHPWDKKIPLQSNEKPSVLFM